MADRCLFAIKGYRRGLKVASFFAIGMTLCSLASADWITTLNEIYQTSIPKQIRRNFDQTTQIHNTCSECVLGILNGEEFLGIYSKKFLVLSLESNSFGGVWAYIAVDGDRKNTYRLWLYDVDEGEYDLRSVEELPSSMDEEFVSQLETASHHPYWL